MKKLHFNFKEFWPHNPTRDWQIIFVCFVVAVVALSLWVYIFDGTQAPTATPEKASALSLVKGFDPLVLKNTVQKYTDRSLRFREVQTSDTEMVDPAR